MLKVIFIVLSVLLAALILHIPEFDSIGKAGSVIFAAWLFIGGYIVLTEEDDSRF